MVRHGRGAWRKDRHVGAALADQPELVLLERSTNLVVGYLRRPGRRRGRVREVFQLRLAELLVRRGRSRVVAVAIDDHAAASFDFASISSRIASSMSSRSCRESAGANCAAQAWRSAAALLM